MDVVVTTELLEI